MRRTVSRARDCSITVAHVVCQRTCHARQAPAPPAPAAELRNPLYGITAGLELLAPAITALDQQAQRDFHGVGA